MDRAPIEESRSWRSSSHSQSEGEAWATDRLRQRRQHTHRSCTGQPGIAVFSGSHVEQMDRWAHVPTVACAPNVGCAQTVGCAPTGVLHDPSSEDRACDASSLTRSALRSRMAAGVLGAVWAPPLVLHLPAGRLPSASQAFISGVIFFQITVPGMCNKVLSTKITSNSSTRLSYAHAYQLYSTVEQYTLYSYSYTYRVPKLVYRELFVPRPRVFILYFQ